MKKTRIRPNSIADKTIKIMDKIDTEPIATLTFFGVMMGAMAIFVEVINNVYPL